MGFIRNSCGASLDGVILYVLGDEISQPVLLVAENTIVDVSFGTLSAQVTRGDAVLFVPELTVENPAPAADATDQQPHGYITITEEQSALLSDTAMLRLSYVQDGITMHSAGWQFRRT